MDLSHCTCTDSVAQAQERETHGISKEIVRGGSMTKRTVGYMEAELGCYFCLAQIPGSDIISAGSFGLSDRDGCKFLQWVAPVPMISAAVTCGASPILIRHCPSSASILRLSASEPSAHMDLAVVLCRVSRLTVEECGAQDC